MRSFLQIVLPLVAGLHGIPMNSSAQKASRKWPYSGNGSAAAAIMVTVVTALMLLCVKTEPAAARRHTQNLWGDLFGENRPRPRLLGEKKPRLRRAAALPPSIPLPKLRPADAPMTEPEKPVAKPAPAAIDKPAEQAASPPPPSACRLALTDVIAIAPSIPDIKGPGECGGGDLVRLEAVVLPDKRRVSVKPAAILRCTMATAIADWIRSDIAPLA